MRVLAALVFFRVLQLRLEVVNLLLQMLVLVTDVFADIVSLVDDDRDNGGHDGATTMPPKKVSMIKHRRCGQRRRDLQLQHDPPRAGEGDAWAMCRRGEGWEMLRQRHI